MFVSVFLPGVDFADKGWLVGNSAGETLGRKDAEFGFGHVEPASVFGRVMPFEPLDETARFGGGKGRVEGCGRVRAEIVLNQHDLGRVRKMGVAEVPERVGVIDGGSRAAMLVGTSDPQKPSVSMGSAVSSIIPTNPGQPSTLAVRVEIDIPDQKMHATVTIRKNTDASLPATHTIDLRATFADGTQIKGVKDLDLPRLRKDDSLSGDSIAGVKVKINDSYYLIGLTRSDAGAAHNLDLLATRTSCRVAVIMTR
jgi:hypothetical protein